MCCHTPTDYTITGEFIVFWLGMTIVCGGLGFMFATTISYFDGKVTKPPWIWWREK